MRISDPSGPGIGWAMRSARIRSPPTCVDAASSRNDCTDRRISFSGRRTNSRERPLQQLLVGRDPVGRPREWHARGTRAGVGVEDRGEHERPGRTVDRGVVDLGELGDQAATVDAFDDVQLPERPSTIERARVDAADRLAELLGCARRRHRVVADVEVDVEVGILDPVRQVEAERNLDEAPAERRQLVDAFEDQLLHRLDTGPAGHAGRVVDVERGDVTERGRRLHVEEAHIDAAELPHAHDRYVLVRG